jgi:hypothetical protein
VADAKRFLLRLSPDVFEAVRRWADDDLRSINAQIEYLLADQARKAGRLESGTRPAGKRRDKGGRAPASPRPRRAAGRR